jgi:hypothetical protein
MTLYSRHGNQHYPASTAPFSEHASDNVFPIVNDKRCLWLWSFFFGCFCILSVGLVFEELLPGSSHRSSVLREGNNVDETTLPW